MSSDIRTFIIPDSDPEAARIEIAGFLRTIVVDRIETAYADGAWRMLVLYQDARRKEESDQIESAIKGALGVWRDREAARLGVPRESVLGDVLLNEIAHFAPTTERELIAIASTLNVEIGRHGSTIVQEVKKMLEALIE